MRNEDLNNLYRMYGKKIDKNQFIDLEENLIINRSEVTGKILKYLRKKIGFTQKELAERLGIAQQTYAGYESGKHEPNIETMIRLADIYNTSMDYITGRYLGNSEDLRNMEDCETEKYLDQTAMHYEIQRMQTVEFMKAIREK